MAFPCEGKDAPGVSHVRFCNYGNAPPAYGSIPVLATARTPSRSDVMMVDVGLKPTENFR